MKISLKWLGDHVDLTDYLSKAEELAKLLTSVGLEVEAVENRGEQFKHVVVGQIQKLERHPNADRLTVCQVDIGTGTAQQIVCGATNHKAGDRVVVTLPGAVLPGDFAIKKSKIRDVESLGMLASESELGLKKESEGILLLPSDAPIGQSFAEYYGLDDVIFEINVSPNRADCLSHLGLARELSCLLNRPLRTPAAEFKTSPQVSTKAQVQLEVKATKLCSRYAGRVVQGVRVGPSPAWLKARLESVGMNSINNVVDVTNFIMMDLGQPLHAFDVARLRGARLIVDQAQSGEVFITLDGRELKLGGDELTIRDAEGAVCIAGAMGGANSGVIDSTQMVFIESAHFALDSVRKTARRHGLQTDSAYRFARGTDPSGVIKALDRACALLQQVAGGQVAQDFYDNYPAPAVPRSIAIQAEYVEQRLGYSVQQGTLSDWFKRLGCKVEVAGETLQVTPPEFRMDLEQREDLVEEFGRLNGYEHIPENLPVLSYAPLAMDKAFVFETRMVELAVASGFSQCVNFGFTSSKAQSALLGPVEAYRSSGLEMDSRSVSIQNPLNEDLDVMRVSLLPGLIKNLLHNYRYGNSLGRLFEVGQVFRHGPEGYEQDARISFAIWGLHTELWQKHEDEKLIFFELKARLTNVFEHLLLPQVQFQPWKEAPSLLHPAQTATVFVEGRNIGFIGTIHPKWSMAEKLRAPVAVAELDLKALSRGQPRQVKFKPVSKFPAVERDLAFVLPEGMLAAEVAAEIKKSSGPLLQSIEVFDVFSGGNLPPGHVSIAYRMIFQDLEGTLSEEKLTSLQNQIVSGVQKKLGINVR
jgi:phenylalanyl-tRNA synthetase beta chain